MNLSKIEDNIRIISDIMSEISNIIPDSPYQTILNCISDIHNLTKNNEGYDIKHELKDDSDDTDKYVNMHIKINLAYFNNDVEYIKFYYDNCKEPKLHINKVLTHACNIGSTELVKYFLNKISNVYDDINKYIHDNFDESDIMRCCLENNYDVLRILLRNGFIIQDLIRLSKSLNCVVLNIFIQEKYRLSDEDVMTLYENCPNSHNYKTYHTLLGNYIISEEYLRNNPDRLRKLSHDKKSFISYLYGLQYSELF